MFIRPEVNVIVGLESDLASYYVAILTKTQGLYPLYIYIYIYILEETYTSAEMQSVYSAAPVIISWRWTLDVAVYISYNANSLEKGMIPTILPPAKGK